MLKRKRKNCPHFCRICTKQGEAVRRERNAPEQPGRQTGGLCMESARQERKAVGKHAACSGTEAEEGGNGPAEGPAGAARPEPPPGTAPARPPRHALTCRGPVAAVPAPNRSSVCCGRVSASGGPAGGALLHRLAAGSRSRHGRTPARATARPQLGAAMTVRVEGGA